MASEQLRSYLAAGQQNIAVLTEQAGIEIQKGDTLKSMFASLAVLSKYPDQAIILKGTRQLCGLDGRGRGLQKRLIDAPRTRDFAKYCEQIERARAGDVRLQAQMLERGREAGAIADRVLAAAPDFTEGRRQIASLYTEAELRTIRTRGVMSKDLGDKISKNVLLLAAILFRDHPQVTEWPDAETLTNRYLFRYALCAHLWLLDWVAHGSQEGANPARVRNDIFDLHFATCATYFDGLMSSDEKALRIYHEAMRLLPGMSRSPSLGSSRNGGPARRNVPGRR
jgi:hypothetical protein